MTKIPTTVDEIICHVIEVDEGGWKFTNDPNDPGGATYAGVTYNTFVGYMDGPDLTVEQFTKLSLENNKELQVDIVNVYKKLFYDPLKLDQLPDYIRCMLFSMAVNVGVRTAGTLLQEVINWEMPRAHPKIVEDGIIGEQTVLAANQFLVFNLELIRMRVKLRLFNRWMTYYNNLVVSNAQTWHSIALNEDSDKPKPKSFRATYLQGWFNRAYRYVEVE